MKKREYRRCSTACSTPPIYWSTGSHASISFGSTTSSECGEANLAKYHEESTNVSIVSVSRRASPPHSGHVTCFHVGWWSSGLPGRSKVASSGRSTGRSASGTGTVPQRSQWIIGIGQPQ